MKTIKEYVREVRELQKTVADLTYKWRRATDRADNLEWEYENKP